MHDDRGSSTSEREDADEAAREASDDATMSSVVGGSAPAASRPTDPVDTVHPVERPD